MQMVSASQHPVFSESFGTDLSGDNALPPNKSTQRFIPSRHLFNRFVPVQCVPSSRLVTSRCVLFKNKEIDSRHVEAFLLVGNAQFFGKLCFLFWCYGYKRLISSTAEHNGAATYKEVPSMLYEFVFMHMSDCALLPRETLLVRSHAPLVMHAKLRRECWSCPFELSSSTVEPDGRTSVPVNWFSESAIRGRIVTPVILMQLHLNYALAAFVRIYRCARSFEWYLPFYFPLRLCLLFYSLFLSLLNSFFFPLSFGP